MGRKRSTGQCAIGYARTLLGLPVLGSGCESRHIGFPGEDVEDVEVDEGRKSLARGTGRIQYHISN